MPIHPVLKYVLEIDDVDNVDNVQKIKDEVQRLSNTLSVQADMDALLDCFMMLANPCHSTTPEAYADFRTWLGENYGPFWADARNSDALASWLAFAHVGRMQTTTPASWVFALDGLPFVPAVSTSRVPLSLLLRAWDDANAASAANAGSDDMCAFIIQVLPVSVEDFKEWTDGHWEVLRNRLKLLSEIVPYLDWYTDSGPFGREACFQKLCAWVAGDWTRSCAGDKRLMALFDARRVTSTQLREFEAAYNVVFPMDVRRILLQVGDVGKALFGRGIISGRGVLQVFRFDFSRFIVPEGIWPYDARVDPLPHSEIGTGGLPGGWVLGYGGGIEEAHLIVQCNGRHRGRVWIQYPKKSLYESDDDYEYIEWVMEPLCDCEKSRWWQTEHRRMSDVFRAMSYGAGDFFEEYLFGSEGCTSKTGTETNTELHLSNMTHDTSDTAVTTKRAKSLPAFYVMVCIAAIAGVCMWRTTSTRRV